MDLSHNPATYFLAIVGSVVLYALLAWWVARRRWPWAVQLLLLLAALTPLVLVEVRDEMLALVVTLACVWCTTRFSYRGQGSLDSRRTDELRPKASGDRKRHTTARREGSFSLGDLLLAMAVVSAAMALILRFGPTSAANAGWMVLFGFGLAVPLVLAILIRRWQKRWWLALLIWPAAIALTALAGAIGAVSDTQQFLYAPPLRGGAAGISPFMQLWQAFAMCYVVMLLLMGILLWSYERLFGRLERQSSVVSSKFSHRDTQADEPLQSGVAQSDGAATPKEGLAAVLQWAYWPLQVAAAILLIGVIGSSLYSSFVLANALRSINLIKPTNSQPIDPAAPNGLDELLALGSSFGASQLLNGIGPTGPVPGKALAAEVKRFESDFEKVQVAIERPQQYLLNFDESKEFSHFSGNILRNYQDLRAVARALFSRSQQSMFEQRYDDALGDLVACSQASRGMVNNDSIWVAGLVGCAIEGIGLSSMPAAILNASGPALEEAKRKLLARETPQLNLDRIFENDRYFTFSKMGWRERGFFLVARPDTVAPAMEQLTQAFTRIVSNRRQAIVAIALQQFFNEHGAYPQRLSELVPQYLDAVPLDPFSRAEPQAELSYYLGPPSLPQIAELASLPVRVRFDFERLFELQQLHAMPQSQSGLPTLAETPYTLYSVGPDGNDDRGLATSSPIELDLNLYLADYWNRLQDAAEIAEARLEAEPEEPQE